MHPRDADSITKLLFDNSNLDVRLVTSADGNFCASATVDVDFFRKDSGCFVQKCEEVLRFRGRCGSRGGTCCLTTSRLVRWSSGVSKHVTFGQRLHGARCRMHAKSCHLTGLGRECQLCLFPAFEERQRRQTCREGRVENERTVWTDEAKNKGEKKGHGFKSCKSTRRESPSLCPFHLSRHLFSTCHLMYLPSLLIFLHG